jgi:purine-nucleoside phosphorylase
MFEISQEVAASILGPEAAPPRVAVVLGSGFGGLARLVQDARMIAYADIPDFPHPEVEVLGNAGNLLLGHIADVPVVVFQGRVHAYQGLSALDAAYTARLAAALGVETLVVTNAAGGVSPKLSTGDIVLIEDHINLSGGNPLVGWGGPAGGTQFVSMRDAYDPELRAMALSVAAEQGVRLHRGVYTCLLGPSFETPAEVAMLLHLGTDVVGMSTVQDVIAARALGMRVLGLSLVTNTAAHLALDHTAVLAEARSMEPVLTGLMEGLVRRL